MKKKLVYLSLLGALATTSTSGLMATEFTTESNLTIDLPERVNGRTAELVSYKGGAFVQLSGKEWVQNTESYSFPFVETHRDEWSVYLSATDRNVKIQLDLWTMQVKYSDPSQSFVLFQIETATPARTNGWTAQKALVNNAAFIQVNRTQWVQNTDTYAFPFVETHRDEWSVYLKATDRANVYIQLDYWRGEVIYRDSTNEFVLYQIDESQPERQTGWSVREVDYRGGSFKQDDHRNWSENGKFKFVETQRDEWSVYLTSTDRPGVFIQLDLWTKEVKYRGPGYDDQIVLYRIIDAD